MSAPARGASVGMCEVCPAPRCGTIFRRGKDALRRQTLLLATNNMKHLLPILKGIELALQGIHAELQTANEREKAFEMQMHAHHLLDSLRDDDTL